MFHETFWRNISSVPPIPDFFSSLIQCDSASDKNKVVRIAGYNLITNDTMASEEQQLIEIVKSHIGDFPDFPKPGILFK